MSSGVVVIGALRVTGKLPYCNNRNTGVPEANKL